MENEQQLGVTGASPTPTGVTGASPASTPAEPPVLLEPEQMTKEQRNDWLLKGEIATAAPAATPEGEAGTPAPGSDPGKPPEQKKGGDANTRIRELAAENKRLKDQLAQGQQPKTDVTPAPSPGQQRPAQQQQPKPPQRPAKPDALTFKGTHTEYEAAIDKYQEDLADWKYQVRRHEEKQQEAQATYNQRIAEFNRQVQTSWNEQTAKAKGAHADFQQVAIDQKIPINPVMDRVILQSQHGAELLYKLGSNLTEAGRIAALDPMSSIKELMRIEIAIEGAPAAPAGGTAPASPAPALKPQGSNAPPPVADLGARNGKPADELEKAVKDDDFEAFYAAEMAAKGITNARRRR